MHEKENEALKRDAQVRRACVHSACPEEAPHARHTSTAAPAK
jgi:hypothetical protein